MSKKDKASKKRLDIQVSPGEAEQLAAAAPEKFPEATETGQASVPESGQASGDDTAVKEAISALTRIIEDIASRTASLESRPSPAATLEDVTKSGAQDSNAILEELAQLREVMRLNTEHSSQLKSRQENLNIEVDELKRSQEAYVQMNRDMVSVINEIPQIKENIESHMRSYEHLKGQVEQILAGMSDSSKPQIIVQEADHSHIEKKLNENLELLDGMVKESEEKQKKHHLDLSAKLGSLEEQISKLSQKITEAPADKPQADIGEFRALIEEMKAESKKEILLLKEKSESAEAHYNELKKNVHELRAEARPGETMAAASGAESMIQKQFNEAHKSSLKFTMTTLLDVMIDNNASVLHVRKDSPPQVRVDGELIPVGDATLSDIDCARLFMPLLDKDQQETLVNRDEVVFSQMHKSTLFHFNIFIQRNSIGAAVKMHPPAIPAMTEFNLTDEAKAFLADLSEGLVLIAGQAASGRTTLAASIIDHINSTKKLHIITLEDPIEFLHRDKISLVTQREFGTDFIYFSEALRQTLKKDPDVIFIGELDDPEIIMEALIAADSGKLVITTAGGANSIRAIERIIENFSGEERIRAQAHLSRALRLIIATRLIDSQNSDRKIAATEIMMNSREISRLISQNKLYEITPQMETGAMGMRTFLKTYTHLLESGLITEEDIAVLKEELLVNLAR
jgi:twitching motility protein PilT